MTTDVKVLIAEFLRTHKRLVVPQLGAFIVKAPGGEILFSELFKRDDGVLRGLLTAAGASEIEAAGAIDRLIFDLRHAVQHGGVYLVAGLGPQVTFSEMLRLSSWARLDMMVMSSSPLESKVMIFSF